MDRDSPCLDGQSGVVPPVPISNTEVKHAHVPARTAFLRENRKAVLFSLSFQDMGTGEAFFSWYEIYLPAIFLDDGRFDAILTVFCAVGMDCWPYLFEEFDGCGLGKIGHVIDVRIGAEHALPGQKRIDWPVRSFAFRDARIIIECDNEDVALSLRFCYDIGMPFVQQIESAVERHDSFPLVAKLVRFFFYICSGNDFFLVSFGDEGGCLEQIRSDVLWLLFFCCLEMVLSCSCQEQYCVAANIVR